MQAEAMLGHPEQQRRFDKKPGGSRDRRSVQAEMRNQKKTAYDVGQERSHVDQRTSALLAYHVEKAFCRANRGARKQPDGEDEHQWISVDKPRPEQRQKRIAEREDDHGCRERGPKCPTDRLGEKVRKPLVLAGRVILRKPVRGGSRNGEIYESHE